MMGAEINPRAVIALVAGVLVALAEPVEALQMPARHTDLGLEPRTRVVARQPAKQIIDLGARHRAER